MTFAGRVALLVGLWLLAWGEASLANILSGVAVAVVLLLTFPPDPGTGAVRLHPVGIVRLVAHVAVQLVTSNVVMAREIVRRRTQLRPFVVAHDLERSSDEILTLMTSIIALSPGTMTVDVDRDRGVVHVHFLLTGDREGALGMLRHLEDLVVGAIGRTTPSRRPPPPGAGSGGDGDPTAVIEETP